MQEILACSLFGAAIERFIAICTENNQDNASIAAPHFAVHARQLPCHDVGFGEGSLP